MHLYPAAKVSIHSVANRIAIVHAPSNVRPVAFDDLAVRSGLHQFHIGYHLGAAWVNGEVRMVRQDKVGILPALMVGWIGV